MERVVKHRMGTVAIEGDQVVVRLSGTRKEGMFGPTVPWSDEHRVPLALARATVAGNELVVRHGQRAVQSVRGDPDEIAAWAEALEEAKRALAAETIEATLAKATCSHCGAPGQTVRRACSYCGHPVAG